MSAIEPCHSLKPDRRSSATLMSAGLGLAGIGTVASIVWQMTLSWRMLALVLVGGLIGGVLQRSSFGFAGGFRRFITERDGSALRAQIVMLAVMSAMAIPLVAAGEVFGLRLVGVVTPVGVAFVSGAVMFGVGMQMAGGCASGTLFGMGGGNLRLVVALVGLVSGSTLGASHMGYWWSLPKFEAITLWQSFSLPLALAAQGAILLAAWGLVGRVSRKPPRTPAGAGEWTLMQGAVALACLNVAVLLLSGQPWGEAPAFALWGSKLAAASGVDVFWWDYWSRPGFDRQIEASVLTDSVTVITIGIVLGAFVSALQSGTFRLRLEGGITGAFAALAGGILMGYGARLTNGCNIGAYFSGVGTGALSGWVWLAFALAGSYVGITVMRWCVPVLSRRNALNEG